MFDSKLVGGEVVLVGRFDASQVEKAKEVFSHVVGPGRVNLTELEYISSAGLGVLLMTQKRLNEVGYGLTLVNMNKHIRDIFHFAGFDLIFQIE